METPTVLTARLLVTLDGPALAEQALAYALELQTPDTELVLAHVLLEPEPRYDAEGQLRAPVEGVLDTELTAAVTAMERRAAAWGLPRERVHPASPSGTRPRSCWTSPSSATAS